MADYLVRCRYLSQRHLGSIVDNLSLSKLQTFEPQLKILGPFYHFQLQVVSRSHLDLAKDSSKMQNGLKESKTYAHQVSC